MDRDIFSYKIKSIVKWGSSGTVIFVTKEARLCGMNIGDPVTVSVVEDKGEKIILIRKLAVKIKKSLKSRYQKKE